LGKTDWAAHAIVGAMRKKKLTKKQREEVVTKGYLEDLLEEKDYVTKSHLNETLYDMMNTMSETMDRKISIAMDKQLQEFNRNMGALMEHQMHQIQIMFESLDTRYVLRSEWLGQR
jgi:hypothetical protein